LKTIELTQGKVALVDDEDFEELNQYKWYAHKQKNAFYAIRNSKGANRTTIHMHRLIMGTPEGMQIDHIDGNGLDNTKSNLRIVTIRQNAQNRHEARSSTYPGVYWQKDRGKWHANITINGKTKSLGRFEIEAEAYEAYLKALEGLGDICVSDIAV